MAKCEPHLHVVILAAAIGLIPGHVVSPVSLGIVAFVLPAHLERTHLGGYRSSESKSRLGWIRTTGGVEDAQVIDSTKREKGEKPQIRLTEVHAGYTGRIVFLASLRGHTNTAADS
jgi:hypothetical protein